MTNNISTRRNLIIVVLALISIGVVMIYSSSAIYAHKYLDDSLYFLKRHIFYLAIGMILTSFVMAIDYRILQKYSKPLIVVSVLLLVLVLIPHVGKEVSGAKRWFKFAGFSFQPSEFAQLCVILYAADFLTRRKSQQKKKFLDFLPLMMVLGFIVLLILVQPDLGTSFSLTFAIMIMIYYAGMNLKYLLGIFLAALPALSWIIFSTPYRRARILAFLNPWEDPQGTGFQIIQSQIALGSGGIFGTGLGQSKQKLFYLPAAHTDFIFAIIGEELGIIGSLLLVGLFIFFIWQVSKVINNCKDHFGKFLAVGLLAIIMIKAVINMAVSCGLMPTKGLPLPFISYGGTSLVMDLLAIGLILNISVRSGVNY